MDTELIVSSLEWAGSAALLELATSFDVAACAKSAQAGHDAVE